MNSRSLTSTLDTGVILYLNQQYNTIHLSHEEFVNLGAILNILLIKQYVSVMKNHCQANNSTSIQP